VQEKAYWCSDAVADVEDSQTCKPRINQYTDTITKLTGERV